MSAISCCRFFYRAAHPVLYDPVCVDLCCALRVRAALFFGLEFTEDRLLRLGLVLGPATPSPVARSRVLCGLASRVFAGGV